MSLFNTKVDLPVYFYIGERLNNNIYWDFYDFLDKKLLPEYITNYSKKLIVKLETFIPGSRFFFIKIKKYPFPTPKMSSNSKYGIHYRVFILRRQVNMLPKFVNLFLSNNELRPEKDVFKNKSFLPDINAHQRRRPNKYNFNYKIKVNDFPSLKKLRLDKIKYSEIINSSLSCST
jgi:hypothetical protein